MEKHTEAAEEIALEEIRTRICAALREPEADWVAHACRVIDAHENRRARLRIFSVETLGDRIRCARSLAGLRQYELARRVGLTQRDISRMEKGQTDLPARKVEPLRITLGVKAAWLLGTSTEGGPAAPHSIRITPSMARKAEKKRVMAEARARASELLRQRKNASPPTARARGDLAQGGGARSDARKE